MKHGERLSLIRLNELQQQIFRLANLRPSAGAVVSCYLDLGQERSQLGNFIRDRLGSETGGISAEQRGELERCIDVIESQLESGLPARARGLAIFASADGRAPLLSAMPFAVPFRNSLSISRSPDLLPLLQLKELYGRFLIVRAEPEGLQLAEVNLGGVSVKAWASTRAHAVAHHAGNRSQHESTAVTGFFSQVSLIEKRLGKGGSCPVFLAGDVDMMQAIRDLLGPSSVARLMGALPMPVDATLQETAAVCLRTLMDFEASQARSTAAQVLRGVRNQGHAVAGAVAVLDAIRNGIADRLVISTDYRPGSDQMFDGSGEQRSPMSLPDQRRRDSQEKKDTLNLRLELIRLAAQQGCPVEFADSEALQYLGGVGCLLHDQPQALAQPMPPRYGSLDLVA